MGVLGTLRMGVIALGDGLCMGGGCGCMGAAFAWEVAAVACEVARWVWIPPLHKHPILSPLHLLGAAADAAAR